MVNQAIAHRLRMVNRSGLFSDDPKAETLGDVFARVATTGGFVVFDLAEMSHGRLRALTSGLNRRLDQICVDERESGRGRYPFVFYEEAHFYAAPGEIINLITRGRHLGLTTFFMTNSPGELPEVVFRQLDNIVVTGLSHTADLRTIGKSAVSDEDTLRSLAMSLPPPARPDRRSRDQRLPADRRDRPAARRLPGDRHHALVLDRGGPGGLAQQPRRHGARRDRLCLCAGRRRRTRKPPGERGLPKDED
jgi:hypothetical protein